MRGIGAGLQSLQGFTGPEQGCGTTNLYDQGVTPTPTLAASNIPAKTPAARRRLPTRRREEVFREQSMARRHGLALALRW